MFIKDGSGYNGKQELEDKTKVENELWGCCITQKRQWWHELKNLQCEWSEIRRKQWICWM